jgi:hypothetical protein
VTSNDWTQLQQQCRAGVTPEFGVLHAVDQWPLQLVLGGAMQRCCWWGDGMCGVYKVL